MPPKKESQKPKVIEHLYDLYKQGEIPDGIVTSKHIIEAIGATNAVLGKMNPANFVKDVIRSENANKIWPESLKKKRVSARQRYGGTRVFQFVPYVEGQDEPFPDRFLPNEKTHIHTVQSASMSYVARRLGRKEETWLTQIVVNLRLIESQLAIFSPVLRSRVRDVAHLQMGMKTQPEIDAVFLATFAGTKKTKPEAVFHMLITCEAKQLGQRILEDQIKEQVAKAMYITRKLKAPKIDAVKPVAVKIVKHEFNTGVEKAIHIVEFEHIVREKYKSEWTNNPGSEEQLYSMPLDLASDTIYRIMPPISGLNA